MSKRMAFVVSIVGVFLLIFSFSCEKSASVKPQSFGPKEAVAASRSDADVGIYQRDIQPLTAEQCAQCHFSYFDAIRKQGGKHQIECTDCHTTFHAYSPKKQNFDEIMPKCITCHKSASNGPFHGDDPKLTPCLNCHANPHTPLNIPMGDIEAACGDCHAKENNEIQNYPSAHTTDVGCGDCHADEHGYIPGCDMCHASHSPQVEMTSKDCMSCHPVHKPTQITYGPETGSIVCANCHEEVYGMLQAKVTKHTAVTCADCHPVHKQIPLCSRCHGQPHPRTMMKDTTKCGDCHGIAHDLST